MINRENSSNPETCELYVKKGWVGTCGIIFLHLGNNNWWKFSLSQIFVVIKFLFCGLISFMFSTVVFLALINFIFLQSRDVQRSKPDKVREANMYFFIEALIALAVSLVINVFVVSVFAHGLYQKTNQELVRICLILRII